MRNPCINNLLRAELEGIANYLGSDFEISCGHPNCPRCYTLRGEIFRIIRSWCLYGKLGYDYSICLYITDYKYRVDK